ncbi:MAG: exonuclease SbcCD subunit D [Candidatus Aminicenantales bacterium]
MKILHTADIHLRSDKDERWKTLEKLISLGRKEKVDLFVISGDLFDKGAAAEKLRPKLRPLFSKTGFRIVIVPGNHDSDSYRGGLYFGQDAVILNDRFKPFEMEGVRVLALPYERIEGREMADRIDSLKKLCRQDKKNILLCHGELLDSFFSREDFGQEGKERYMPFWLSNFDELDVECVLAGHFHKSFDVRRMKNEAFFVYPGSPVSITRRETGQRKVNLFKLGEEPQEYALDSPHYQEILLKLNPLEEMDPVAGVKKILDGLPPGARALVKVSGFVNCRALKTSETELEERIEELVEKKGELETFECRDIQEIGEDDLFKDFVRILNAREPDFRKREELIEITLRAMIEARG